MLVGFSVAGDASVYVCEWSSTEILGHAVCESFRVWFYDYGFFSVISFVGVVGGVIFCEVGYRGIEFRE